VTAQRVLLWRHGRTTFNHESRFQGQLDVALDDLGMEQAQRGARLLAGQIAEFGHPETGPVRLVTSDLARASRTAAALGELLNITPEPDQRLREIFAGSWQGMTSSQITQRWPEDYSAWRRGEDVRVGGGETRWEAAARGAACITEAAESMDGGTLVIASHGATLRGAIFVLLGWPSESWNCIEALRNAHWAQLQHMPYGWRLAAYNLGGIMEEYEPSPETATDDEVTAQA
jgi:probable phosphoglycerate mutase